tara:strand:+ start:393422 stop:395641 length:2220 start_codon:yes stop_codon:yes gene_type:complete
LAADLLLDALDPFAPLSHEIPSQEIPSQANVSSPAGVQQQVDPHSTIQSDSPDLLTQALQLRQAAGIDGSGQTVAVIDSGIAWDHDVFRTSGNSGFGPGYRVVGGWDFAEDDADPYDDGPAGYHGSHVAGLLAGESESFVGIAPGADLVALRVFDDDGGGQLQWIESALQWVHDNKDAHASPITTVNLSIGALLGEENLAEARLMLEDELQLLREDNILVFAAAGNAFDASGTGATSGDEVISGGREVISGGREVISGGREVMYPASSTLVQAVGSVGDDGALSEFSQRQSGILAADGESVSSSVPEHVFGWDGKIDDIASLSGTSMAAPQVAAASMLVRQSMIAEGLDPTVDEIMQRLQASSRQHHDSITGDAYHVIDLDAAITGAVQSLARYDGDNESQQAVLDLTDGIRLTVDGNDYVLDPLGDSPLVIDVGGGADSLRILGSEQAERIVLDPINPDNNQLSTNTYRIELRGFEEVIFDGGGGRDRATLYDTDGDETLQSYPGAASLSGIGFRFEVNNVPRMYAHATAGGNDTAFVRDSAGDDVLNVRPQFTSLRGDDTFQLAYGFESVYAYATSGGTDTAELYDSDGDDLMSISPTRSIITGAGYQVSARGFDLVNAYATGGGNDLAKIYGDVDDDSANGDSADAASQWHTSGQMTQWTSAESGKVHVARGFERTQAFEDFQPIELTPQSTAGPFNSQSADLWSVDDREARAAQEADALRAIFESLGEDTNAATS